MSNGRDNYAWELAQEAKAEEKRTNNWRLRQLADKLSTLESDTDEGRQWLWMAENADKAYNNRRLIDLLG